MTVFLSYSTKDFHFAELLELKLTEAKIKLWRDKNGLIAGLDWKQGIEEAISKSEVVLIALSQSSSESAYVTYEWAYAIGKGKSVIPMKLEPCNIHPRLESLQHLDFSSPGSLPWETLIQRIKEAVTDSEQDVFQTVTFSEKMSKEDGLIVKAILNYLNQNGFQMASFEKLRTKLDIEISDEEFATLIQKNKRIFRTAVIKGGKKGLAKLVP